MSRAAARSPGLLALDLALSSPESHYPRTRIRSVMAYRAAAAPGGWCAAGSSVWDDLFASEGASWVMRRGTLASEVQGEEPWGESPQTFDCTRTRYIPRESADFRLHKNSLHT